MKRISLSFFLLFTSFLSIGQIIPTNGLIASYSFSGNAINNASLGLNGVINGAVLSPNRFNIANEAYFFNGTSNIDISSSTLRNPEFTYAAWVKPTSLPGTNELQNIFSVGGNGADQQMGINNSYYANTDGRAKFGSGGYVGYQVNGPNLWLDQLVEIDQWYFLTVVRSLDSLKMYVDGDLKFKTYSEGLAPHYASSFAKIGSRYSGIQGFTGVIDDFYIYNRALANSEIMSIKKFGEVLPTNSVTDLSLKASQVNRKVEIGSEIETKLVLKNNSQVAATNIKVYVNTPNSSPFVQFKSSLPSFGNFNINSGLWEIPNLAGGDSVNITLKYVPNGSGIWFLESEIYSLDQQDGDSTPLNFNSAEDDYTKTCVSVPIKVADANFFGRQILIQDTGITNITWKKDGVLIPNQTSSILQVTTVGSYTFESPNFPCPSQGCCPYVFEQGVQTLCCEPLEYFFSSEGLLGHGFN